MYIVKNYTFTIFFKCNQLKYIYKFKNTIKNYIYYSKDKVKDQSNYFKTTFNYQIYLYNSYYKSC